MSHDFFQTEHNAHNFSDCWDELLPEVVDMQGLNTNVKPQDNAYYFSPKLLSKEYMYRTEFLGDNNKL